jgi:Alkylmercury lyase
MLLFRSEEHIDRWCEERGLPRGYTMPLDTAWALAKAWFGVDRRSPEWRRRTIDESEAVFSAVGLTGPFWSLRT